MVGMLRGDLLLTGDGLREMGGERVDGMFFCVRGCRKDCKGMHSSVSGRNAWVDRCLRLWKMFLNKEIHVRRTVKDSKRDSFT